MKRLENTYNPLSDLEEDYIITGEGATYYINGAKCINKGKYKNAIKNFEKAVRLAQLSKERSVCYFLIGDCYGKLNRISEEIAAYEKATELDASNKVAWIYLSDAYERHDDYDKADECYEYLDTYFGEYNDSEEYNDKYGH